MAIKPLIEYAIMHRTKSCELMMTTQGVIQMLNLNRAALLASISIVVTSLFLLSSCSSTTAPGAMQIRPDKVPDFSLTGALYVKNVQSDSEQKNLGAIGVVEFEGDLQSWTDTAVVVLTNELSRRGAKIDDQATTGLSISVDKIVMGVEGMRYAGTPRGQVTISVKTDEGYYSSFAGEYTSLIAFKVAGGAITVAIEAMLNDQEIRDFLTAIGSN